MLNKILQQTFEPEIERSQISWYYAIKFGIKSISGFPLPTTLPPPKLRLDKEKIPDADCLKSAK